jgi:beta-N-acetylglucosaminidase
VLWDNYPVNDAVMETELHLGPYRGRTAALTDVLDGVLCNPMLQPHASKLALATAAEFLRDPDRYDADAAWQRAIDDLGGPRADALGALARACADGPLSRPCTLQLHGLVDHLARDVDAPSWPEGASRLRDELTTLRRAEAAYADADDDPLGAELGPWLSQARREADAGLAALRLLQQVRPVATLSATGDGRAAAPDAESAMIHAFALLFSWSGARDGRVVVGGPRFALHPAVVQRASGEPMLDVDLALRENTSALDQLCRLALREYQHWAVDADAPLGAREDLEPISVAADGSFHTAAPEVLVHCGPRATLVTAGTGPPFPDARLT